MSSEKKATHSSTQAKTLLSKIGEVVLCAAFPFTLLILYLRLSEHASLLTSLLICAGISIPYVVLAKKFVTVRCASAVCIVQFFSHFGLFMVFILWSWVTIQQALQGVIRLQHDINSPICTNMTDSNSTTADPDQEEDDEETDWLSSEIELVKTVMVYLHYGGLLPLLGLFVYSYVYERTYSILRTSSPSSSPRQGQAASPSHNAPDPEESPDFITISVKSLFWLIAVCSSAGFILCCTTSIIIIEYLFYEFALSSDFSNTCQEYIASQKMSYLWIIAYFAMCLSTFVLSCFSRRILKVRAIIIKKFELISDDEFIMAAQSANVGMQQQRSRGGNGNRQNHQDGNIVITIPRELR